MTLPITTLAEQALAQHKLDPRKVTTEAIRVVNRVFRAHDDSSKWPIEGAFNATDRAIRQMRRWARAAGGHDDMISYIAGLDAAIGRIVNDTKNW